MQFVRRFGGQRSVTTALLTVAAIVGSACSADRGQAPIIPGNPAPNPQITQAAFLADVDVRGGVVKVREPQLKGTQGGLSSIVRGSKSPATSSVDFSLVGGDVVTLTSSNFVASAVGAFQPGKVRVTFDINITNKLTGVQLIGPTVFPAPPAGTTGPLLFPYDIAVAVTSGGTATGGQGNDIIVTLPSYGLVAPSTDWNGAPHNFFNDVGCAASTTSDCFRYEEFTGPIGPGSTTTARSVGFDLDPTVGQFTARLIVAADLQNAGAPLVGTIAGTVTSPQLGTLNGVVVTATAGITTLTGTTAGAGAYSIGSVPTGPASAIITSGLPAGCTNPGAQSTTVASAATSTVNFTVVCPTPVGSVTGTITFTGATPSPTGINVIVTPTGLGATPAVNPNAAGLYTRSAVPVGVGSGSVALSSLPSGCTAPAAGSYSGLTNGGTATVNFTVACTPPPAGYAYTSTFSGTGATTTLLVSIDMGTFNDPLVNGTGADDISAIQGIFTYNAARLSAPVCSNVGGSLLTNGTFNTSAAGTIQFLNFSTNANPIAATGVQGIASCTFTVIGSPIPGAKTATTLSVVASGAGNDLQPKVIITEGTLP